MAIPWLIGAAVVGLGKLAYDSYEEDERRERSERRARTKRREIEAEATKKREEAAKNEEKRVEQERNQRLKIDTESNAKVLLDKYKITSLTPSALATNTISNPEQAITDITKHYKKSAVHLGLEKKVTALDKSIDKCSELQKILKGI